MIRNLVILCVFMLLVGFILSTSCSKEKDNFPSVTGNIDPATIESSSFKAYFPLESSTYVIIKGGGGIDSSNVVVKDSATFVAGARGYAYQGDIESSFIKIPLLSTGFLHDLHEFTLSCWVKIPAENKKTSNIILINGGDDTYGTLSLTLDSLNLQGTVFNTFTDSTYQVSTLRSDLKADEWTHIIFSFEKSTSRLILYADSKLTNEVVCKNSTSTTIDSLTLSSSMNTMYIGAWPQQINGTPKSSMGYFSGCLDEMRIWNICLSQDEVNSLYQAEQVLTKVQ